MRDNIYSSFEFVDTMSETANRYRLAKNLCTVHNRKNCHRLVFSAALGRELVNSGFKTVRLAANRITGDYALVFQKSEDGHPIRLKTGKSGNQTSMVINSSPLAEAICNAFEIKEGDSARFELGPNDSKREDVRFHLLNKAIDS